MRTTLSLLLSVLAHTAAGRDVIPFSFGWRFYLGDPLAPTGSCNASSFPNDISNVQCSGLQAMSATTAAECLAQACAANAAAWQFCTNNATCGSKSGANCWAGSFTPPCHAHKDWVGGARSAPYVPSPLPAQTDWDDSTWAVVDAPHDALIATPYSQTASNSQGSIPKNVTWCVGGVCVWMGGGGGRGGSAVGWGGS